MKELINKFLSKKKSFAGLDIGVQSGGARFVFQTNDIWEITVK